MNLNEINQRISDRSDCFYWQTDRKISAEEAAMIWKNRHSAITNEELLDKINTELKDDKLAYIKPFDENAQTILGNVNSIRVGVLENGKEEQLVIEMGKTMARLHKIKVNGFGPFDNE